MGTGRCGRSTAIGTKADGTLPAYYLVNFTDRTINSKITTGNCSWRYIGSAEILLIYAETAVVRVQDEEARVTFNIIRNPAGTPDITASGNLLKESISYECQIELMLEVHRYFELRRWRIALQVFSEGALGVKIEYLYAHV